MQKDFVSLLAWRKRMAQREGAEAQRTVSKALAKSDQLRNEQADDMRLSYPYWEAGKTYDAGEIVTDPANGQNYIIMQKVTGAEHQPPHGDGLLALYRPIPRRLADGTFIFIYGQNVFSGDVCRDPDGVAWVALKDMLPCVWPPVNGNEWRRRDAAGNDTGDNEETSGESDTGNDNTGTETPPATSDAPEWVQPTGAADAYQTGNKVTHGGKVWISDVNNNVWEPGVYGWHEVAE